MMILITWGSAGVPLAAWAESLKPESIYRSYCLKVFGRLRFRVRFIKVVEGRRFSFILIMCWEVTFCQVIPQGEENPMCSLLQCHRPPNRGHYITVCRFHQGSCLKHTRSQASVSRFNRKRLLLMMV